MYHKHLAGCIVFRAMDHVFIVPGKELVGGWKWFANLLVLPSRLCFCFFLCVNSWKTMPERTEIEISLVDTCNNSSCSSYE